MFNYFKKKRILKNLTVPHHDYGVLTICLTKKTDLTAKTDEAKQVKKELKEVLKLIRKYTNYKTIPKMVLNTIINHENVAIPPPKKLGDLVFSEHSWWMCTISQNILICIPKEANIYFSDYQSDLVTVNLADESLYMQYEDVFSRAEIPVNLSGEKVVCECTDEDGRVEDPDYPPRPVMYLEVGTYSINCSNCHFEFRTPTKKEISKAKKQLLQQLAE